MLQKASATLAAQSLAARPAHVASQPRPPHPLLPCLQERSPQSPQYGVVRVPASTLGRVIGAGGSNIRALCEATGARITVEDGGEVRIYAPSPAAFADAKERVLEAAGENIQVRCSGTGRRVVVGGGRRFLRSVRGAARLLCWERAGALGRGSVLRSPQRALGASIKDLPPLLKWRRRGRPTM